ncbi:hypothetical protein Barb7_03066 [Bacteroidales bacterium Barb7]|nr:hypothetical protein Barb7_03066 [Bacteroidales bacterium Barb7]
MAVKFKQTPVLESQIQFQIDRTVRYPYLFHFRAGGCTQGNQANQASFHLISLLSVFFLHRLPVQRKSR